MEVLLNDMLKDLHTDRGRISPAPTVESRPRSTTSEMKRLLAESMNEGGGKIMQYEKEINALREELNMKDARILKLVEFIKLQDLVKNGSDLDRNFIKSMSGVAGIAYSN